MYAWIVRKKLSMHIEEEGEEKQYTCVPAVLITTILMRMIVHSCKILLEQECVVAQKVISTEYPGAHIPQVLQLEIPQRRKKPFEGLTEKN